MRVVLDSFNFRRCLRLPGDLRMSMVVMISLTPFCSVYGSCTRSGLSIRPRRGHTGHQHIETTAAQVSSIEGMACLSDSGGAE